MRVLIAEYDVYLLKPVTGPLLLRRLESKQVQMQLNQHPPDR